MLARPVLQDRNQERLEVVSTRHWHLETKTQGQQHWLLLLLVVMVIVMMTTACWCLGCREEVEMRSMSQSNAVEDLNT